MDTEAYWSNTAIDHIPDEWKGLIPIQTPGGAQKQAVLTEEGLYFYLQRSDKPAALPMQKWLAGDVLPSLRKTGRYSLLPEDHWAEQRPSPRSMSGRSRRSTRRDAPARCSIVHGRRGFGRG